MSPSRRPARWTPLLLACLFGAVLLLALRDEMVIGRAPLNDHCLHLPLAERIAEALSRGEDPLDCYVAQWSLGHPIPRTYQPLPALAVAAAWRATGECVDITTVFLAIHLLLLAAWPLSTYAGARLLGIPRWTACAAAGLAPLVATNLLFGLELGSYIWRGSGLFTQLWAQALLPLSVGFGARALRGRGRISVAALLLSLTFGMHFVYGLIGAFALVVIAIVMRRPSPTRRLMRLAGVGLATALLSAWLLVPLLRDGDLVNHSRWEDAWKWDSFGLADVLRKLVTGEVLDYGRIPVLTILALAGVVVVVARMLSRQGTDAERVTLAGTAGFLLLWCGRPAWDGLLDVVGLHDVPLHRLIGGVHFFAVLLAAHGLAAAFEGFAFIASRLAWATPARAKLIAGVLIAGTLAPALLERRDFVRVNREWGRDTLAAIDKERADIDAAVDLCARRGGRAYAGMAGGWGKDFAWKWSPFYSFLSLHRVPSVSYLYHAMALTSDIMVRFDESDAAHWRLFDVRTAVAPPDRELPAFAKEIARFGRLAVFEGPGNGAFDVVDIAACVRCDRRSFYDVVDAWLSSQGPAQRRVLALDLAGRFPVDGMPSQPADTRLPWGEDREIGRVIEEHHDGDAVHEAIVEADEDGAAVMLKLTWHPRWHATVDGRPARTLHVTPGFVAVRVPAGRHAVRFAYQPGRAKPELLLMAGLLLAAMVATERSVRAARGAVSLETRLALGARAAWASPRVREIAGVAGLTLVAALPLLLTDLPGGHDAIVYPPRVVEFHESVRHGDLLPAWAPDLSSGLGQPFFLFTPPLLQWAAEPLFAATGDVSLALRFALLALLLVGTCGMRLLGRELIGERASWIVAAAWVLAPYTLTDLYVRMALAELSALCVLPFALLGLVRHARTGSPRALAIAALGTGLVGLSHQVTTLLAVPLLAGVAVAAAVRTRRAELLIDHATALVVGALLAACSWLPAMTWRNAVHLERAREGYFTLATHAVAAWQLLWSRWGFGYSQEGTGDGMSFMLGVPQIALALAAVALAWMLRRRRALATGLLAGVIATCFLMTTAGCGLLDAVPALRFVQFPWRLLGIVTPALALLAGLACVLMEDAAPPAWRRFVRPAALLVIVAFGYPLARPGSALVLDPLAETPAELARRGEPATAREEMEPATVEERADDAPAPAEILDGDGEARLVERTPTRLVIEGHATSGLLALRLHDFAGWQLDEHASSHDAAKLSPEEVTGRLRVRVPPGDFRIAVERHRTASEQAGIALSLLGLAAVVVLVFGRSMTTAP
jgi:hypothetical protein